MVRNWNRLSRSAIADDADGDRHIERFPDEIAQLDLEARRPHIARRRHVDLLAGAEHDGAEDAADRLGEAAGGVLRRRARIGEAAIPGRRAADCARRQAVDGERALSIAETAMKRKTSRPLYELRLSAIGTIESHGSAACAGIRSPTRASHRRRQAVDDEAGQNAGEQAKGGEDRTSQPARSGPPPARRRRPACAADRER